MPIKYKYNGRDENGDKKFTKTYETSKWVGDYQNHCVRKYDQYIKECLKNKEITEDDIQYIDYFEGSYNNACKFFGISGESCKVYDKDEKEYVIKNDKNSREIKIKRFKDLIEKHQSSNKYLTKTSAELYTLLLSKMNDQYYYIEMEYRDDIAIKAIYESRDIVEDIDNFFFNRAQEIEALKNEGIPIEDNSNSRLFNKRYNNLMYFYSKHNNFWK